MRMRKAILSPWCFATCLSGVDVTQAFCIPGGIGVRFVSVFKEMWLWLMPKFFDWWCLFYSDIEQYILHGDEIYAVLNRLVNHKKKLFLITNSPFSFVWVLLLHIDGSPQRSKSCAVQSLLWASESSMLEVFVAIVMRVLSGNRLWWMLHPTVVSTSTLTFWRRWKAVAGPSVTELPLWITSSSFFCITDFFGLPML